MCVCTPTALVRARLEEKAVLYRPTCITHCHLKCHLKRIALESDIGTRTLVMHAVDHHPVGIRVIGDRPLRIHAIDDHIIGIHAIEGHTIGLYATDDCPPSLCVQCDECERVRHSEECERVHRAVSTDAHAAGHVGGVGDAHLYHQSEVSGRGL